MKYKVALLLVVISAYLYYYLSPAPLSDEQLTHHLTDKVVLICGASSGIGEELAYQLAAHRAKLVLVARSQDKLDKVKTELLIRGTPEENVLILSFDFSDVTRTKEVLDQTLNRFGALDYLVSNHAAMILGPFLGQPHLQSPDHVEKIFRVNLFSHIELAVHALPHLEKRNGHMFFTSSVAGEVAYYKNTLYSSSKHAMNGFFYSLQQELIARESNLSLTIGAFGMIKTKELTQLVKDENSGPLAGPLARPLAGSVEGCSREIMKAYITRPQTLTFPRMVSAIYRASWYFNPYHHDHVIRILRPEGSEGTGYEETVKKFASNAKWRKKIGYQQGYGEQ